MATAGTLAWLGCWRLEAEGEDAVPESADASQFLCLEPGDGPSSLSMRAIVDDQVAAEEMLVADGTKQPVSEGGCSGWKRTLLSADQRRLYLQSETTCEGGNESSFSGALLIVSEGHWVDIGVTRVAGERELLVRHYHIDTAEGADSKNAAGRLFYPPQPELALERELRASEEEAQALEGSAGGFELPGTMPSAARTARVAAAAFEGSHSRRGPLGRLPEG